jgi:uncharacterized LabA/DUF88 family protein
MKSDLKDLVNNLSKISEQMERVTKTPRFENNVAVLWDVENVHPRTDSLFMESFFDYVRKFGHLTVAQAFADWGRRHLGKIASLLSDNHFELVHIPRARKNSADISLVTHGIEIALQHPNIQTFILVTGDVDFRPLIKSLRRNGKRIHIVCDVQIASENLLILADSFIDYRSLRPGGITDKDGEKEEVRKEERLEKRKDSIKPKSKTAIKERKKIAFDLLVEAIRKLKEKGSKAGLGLVKVRLLMLNPNFDEKKLGYSNWSDFVEAAVNKGIIKVEGKGASQILDIAPSEEKGKGLSDLEQMFEILKKTLSKLDKKGKPQYHNFAIVAEELYQNPTFSELKEKLGYKQFKDFIQAAEVRDLVETEVEGLKYSVRRKK